MRPSQWLYNKCKWEPVSSTSMAGKAGSPASVTHSPVGMSTRRPMGLARARFFSLSRFSLYSSYLADCKDHCLAHDKFNSCQGVYPKLICSFQSFIDKMLFSSLYP